MAALALLSSPLVDLRLVRGELDIPLADLLAMALAAGFGLVALRARLRDPARPLLGPLRLGQESALLALPMALPWLAFLASQLLSWGIHPHGSSLHYWFRNPLFAWLTWGAGVAGLWRAMVLQSSEEGEGLRRLALLHALWLSGLLLPASLWLLVEGQAGGALDMPGFINNHKVFAVALAPWPAALLRWRPLWRGPARFAADIILALSLLALIFSLSKTAWLTTAATLVAFLPWRGRPLLARPLPLAALALLGAGAMVALPLLSGADRMADAFDSRWSLNVRAWRMFSDSPLVGWGPGSALTWLMNDPRHYRIDGVEAHGIAQKLISEGGLLGALTGLLAWGLLLRDLARRAVEEGADRLIQGGALLGIGLQLNLLLSTDLYASTHWAPLALALAFCARRP